MCSLSLLNISSALAMLRSFLTSSSSFSISCLRATSLSLSRSRAITPSRMSLLTFSLMHRSTMLGTSLLFSQHLIPVTTNSRLKPMLAWRLIKGLARICPCRAPSLGRQRSMTCIPSFTRMYAD
jgi:hypothetical protein